MSTAAIREVQPAEARQDVQPEYGWLRPIHWPWWSMPSLPPPPPPPSETDPWWCNCPYRPKSSVRTTTACHHQRRHRLVAHGHASARDGHVRKVLSTHWTTDCLAPLASCQELRAVPHQRRRLNVSACDPVLHRHAHGAEQYKHCSGHGGKRRRAPIEMYVPTVPRGCAEASPKLVDVE